MTTKPTSVIQFRIDPIIEEQVNNAAKSHYKGNSSAFFRDATHTLLMFLQFKENLRTDQDKVKFIKSLEAELKSEHIFEFMATQSEEMLGAIMTAAQMVKDGKNQNAKLI